MKKSRLATLLGITLGFIPLFMAAGDGRSAEQYFTFLSSADRTTLLTKGELGSSGSDLESLRLAPQLPFEKILAAEITVPGSTVAQEGLYLFDRPSGDAMLKIYNALNAVKSMAGTQYYSLSQKKMETLILESYRVDPKDKKTPLADPQFTEIPALQEISVFQKDNRLGNGVTKVLYQRQADGSLTLTMTNLEALTYFFVPLVAPGEMKMVFVVIPLADKIAVYAAMEVKTARFFGLEHSKDENFRNRLRALAGWLGKQIGAASR